MKSYEIRLGYLRELLQVQVSGGAERPNSGFGKPERKNVIFRGLGPYCRTFCAAISFAVAYGWLYLPFSVVCDCTAQMLLICTDSFGQ